MTVICAQTFVISKKTKFAPKPISVFDELKKFDNIMYASDGTGNNWRLDFRQDIAFPSHQSYEIFRDVVGLRLCLHYYLSAMSHV